MTATPKRGKKNNAFWAHEHTVTTVTPTGDQTNVDTVLGSRDAFHKQLEIETSGFFAIVHNVTLDREEHRSPNCPK